MSRLTSMSPDAIRAIFSPEADTDLLFLLTIYDPSNPSTVIARVCDGFTKRISETADEVLYGTTSRGNDFVFLPIEVSLPTEEEAQASRCSIVIRDVSRYVIPIVRTIVGPPTVKMELVLSKSPDVVEATFNGFYISSFTYNADSVTADLSMIDYEREPFPMHSFTPAYFPGMF